MPPTRPPYPPELNTKSSSLCVLVAYLARGIAGILPLLIMHR